MKIKSALIILKPNISSDFSSIVPNLVRWLTKRKVKIFFINRDEKSIKTLFKKTPQNSSILSRDEAVKQVDLIITLGGDGTLIGTCRKLNSKSPPVFGINMGSLGFTTEFSKADFFEQLEVVIKGKFETIKLPLFKTQVIRNEKVIFQGLFINDTVLNRGAISRMFSLSVESNSEHIYNLSGDGLIAASPIGSTAYSLAAGGPIIHSGVKGIVLTPVSAHSLTHRPMILPEKSIVTIKIPRGSLNINLTLDGQEHFVLQERDIIQIKQTNRKIRLVKNQEKSYFRTLKSKFALGRGN